MFGKYVEIIFTSISVLIVVWTVLVLVVDREKA
ncbi:hypothetical protein bsdtw1_03276 [Clostridium fungisolvens]|uniref:Uncharacterized protein n=1 Tax=Clostridium fungisolvens TaxID=1604897 RepID=A0A6V8SKT6_9CLOT|nr:hypothetical protein bsdtw1_03276 [Clostridium fungisolvens]